MGRNKIWLELLEITHSDLRRKQTNKPKNSQCEWSAQACARLVPRQKLEDKALPQIHVYKPLGDNIHSKDAASSFSALAGGCSWCKPTGWSYPEVKVCNHSTAKDPWGAPLHASITPYTVTLDSQAPQDIPLDERYNKVFKERLDLAVRDMV